MRGSFYWVEITNKCVGGEESDGRMQSLGGSGVEWRVVSHLLSSGQQPEDGLGSEGQTLGRGQEEEQWADWEETVPGGGAARGEHSTQREIFLLISNREL